MIHRSSFKCSDSDTRHGNTCPLLRSGGLVLLHQDHSWWKMDVQKKKETARQQREVNEFMEGRRRTAVFIWWSSLGRNSNSNIGLFYVFKILFLLSHTLNVIIWVLKVFCCVSNIKWPDIKAVWNHKPLLHWEQWLPLQAWWWKNWRDWKDQWVLCVYVSYLSIRLIFS